MGATDSKLQFKNHLFRLFEEPNIPADDVYWMKVSDGVMAVIYNCMGTNRVVLATTRSGK
jgi:hypothetical protein